MEESKQKEFYYILNLTKKRIFFISFSLISFLSVVFIIGLFIGRFTKGLNSDKNTSIVTQNITSTKGVTLDLNTSPLRHQNTENIVEKPLKKNIKTKKNKKYYIQVFATGNKKKANVIYKNLKIRKYPVSVKIIKKSNKSIFIIRVGLYEEKQRAKRHLKMIRTKFPKAILRVT